MPTKVLVPRLGEGVEEITITKWLKHEGDTVRELEPLLEVNTDKVDTEIPSPASGTLLKIEIEEGRAAKVGEVLALISSTPQKPGQAESDTGSRTLAPAAVETDSTQAAAEPAPSIVHDPSSTVHGPSSLGFISPIVAKIAAERGIDLQQVHGTGLGGRITKEDVLAFVGGDKEKKRETGKQAGRPSRDLTPGISTPETLVKLSPIRKQIAEHMLASKHTSPHVLTVMEADLSRVGAHLSANKEGYNRQGLRLTYTAYFIAALAAGLKAHPLANSSWSEEGLLLHTAVNIGMATSLGEEGLIVPVIKDADKLSLPELAGAVNDLAARARAKKLQPEEVKGGTFTLTNHGTGGSLLAMPIINQPQSGILGVGALQKRVVVVTDANGNDSIAIRPMVYLSFVFDHRILDGASADAFLTQVKQTLENWA